MSGEISRQAIKSIKNYSAVFKEFDSYMEETYSQVALYLPELEKQVRDKKNEAKAVLEFMISGVEGTGVSRSIEEMGIIFEKNTRLLEESTEKYKVIFKNIMAKLDLLQKLNQVIQEMKTLSNEIKIFSMNSVIISSRAGKSGHGFKSISYFIIELSDQINKNAIRLNESASHILMLYDRIKDKFIQLFDEIYEKKLKQKNQFMKIHVKDTISKIQLVNQILNDILDRIEYPVSIIPGIMNDIQKQDIIRQSIQHMEEVFNQILNEDLERGKKKMDQEEFYFNAYLIYVLKKIQEDSEKRNIFINQLNTGVKSRFQKIQSHFTDVAEDERCIVDYLFKDEAMFNTQNQLKTIFDTFNQILIEYNQIFEEEKLLKKQLSEAFVELEKIYQVSLPLFDAVELFYTKMNNINILAQIEISKEEFSGQNTQAIKAQFFSMLDFLRQFKDNIKLNIQKNFKLLLLELKKFNKIQLEQDSMTNSNIQFLQNNVNEINNLYRVIDETFVSVVDSGKDIYRLINESSTKLNVLDEMIERNNSVKTQMNEMIVDFEKNLGSYFTGANLELNDFIKNNPFIDAMQKSKVNLDQHIKESGDVELF